MRIWVPPSQPASVPSAGWEGDPQIRICRDAGYTTSSKPRAYKHSDTHARRPSIYRVLKLFKMLP